jgi:PAP2 superfamily protein
MLISILTTIGRDPLFVMLAVSLSVIEVLGRMWGGPPPSLALFRNPFAAIAAATVFCRYVIDDRRGPTRKWIVYLSPVAFVAAAIVEGSNAPTPLLLLDGLAVLGILGVLGFLVAATRADSITKREQVTGKLMTALIVPMAASMASFGLWSTAGINPVYDGRVYGFEEILGFKFSLLGVQSYHLAPALSAIATGCYGVLPLAIALSAAAQKSRRAENDVLMATVFAGASGFALYFFCPVAGPLHAFKPTYPETLPAITAGWPLITAPIGAPRNGMPSLHTAWALLLWFNSRSFGAGWRWALRVFVAFTLWAVMGLDDTHWFLDVVVAVPFAVAIQLAFVPGAVEAPRRWTDIAICSTVTMMWLFGLKTALPLLALPPALAWAVVVATIWWPLARERAAARTGETALTKIAIAERPVIDSLPA